MWLYSKHGFFSAAQHIDKADVIHVRSQFKGDLERLCKAYGIEPKVTHTPDGDYSYRMNFPRDVWAEIVKSEAMAIDYPKVKPALHDGTKRDRAYLKVFFTMMDFRD
ncbi:MAG: hypothetical protein IJU03_01895 [Thermoguttaceae bacterium]|nr:hypothetical protein [Thermoguttaceae bacterium]